MHGLKKALVIALALCAAVTAGAGAADVPAGHPILFPSQSVAYTAYPDTMINVLLLGIDFGAEGYWGSGYKKDILNCHTDAVMVAAINLTKQRIDIVSLPRDSVTIVPGVRGIYKLNGAVNCAATLAEGLERTQAAVEWLMGGIRIDCYFAVDMNTMFLLGDAIGGVEFEMDMNYTGSSGARYYKGLQQLDGTGIMDYVRARTNATVDGNDLGRTRRQREMMTAVLHKLAGDKQSAQRVLTVLSSPESGFFTSMTGTQTVGFLAALPMLLRMNTDSIASYTLEGRYRSAMGWNFTFTDADRRAEVLKTVYGVDMPPLAYVSYKHAKFYEDSGFYSIHIINIAGEFIAAAEHTSQPLSGEQREMLEQLKSAYRAAADAFQAAADTLDSGDISAMKSARVKMRDDADALAAAIGYEGELPWKYYTAEWYMDPYTNEYQLDWR